MIFLHKPYIKNEKNKSRLIFDIDIDDEKKQVFYEVSKEYGKYLCDDRVDAILIGMLHYAMAYGHDIKSDSYVTDEILYKIKTFLIPSLVKYSDSFQNIEISIKEIKPCEEGFAVGTGCSGGVDSLYSILTNQNHENKDFNLTHLCINNVGSFNESYEEKNLRDVRDFVVEKAKKIAEEVGLPLIITDSNFQDEVVQNHYFTCTYSSTFAILCLQKLWRIYYYGSSGLDFSKFSIIDHQTNCASHYDLLTLDCFSSKGLKIYSDGGAITRFLKIKQIYQHPLFKKYVHPCIVKKHNCNQCPKCRGLILALYLLTDDLDEYRQVIDVDYFLQHKLEYFDWIYTEYHYGRVGMYNPIYEELEKREEFQQFLAQKEKELSKDKEMSKEEYYLQEYEKIAHSKAFKVGSVLLFIPQKIKKFFTKSKS